ncbi:hypothetical protein, partial [Streptomyces spirodelae]
LPALAKIDGIWHCVISGELFTVTKSGRTWAVTRAAESADQAPVASGRTRKEALSAALTVLSVSLALPEPSVTHVGARENARDGGVHITVEGVVSVFYRLERDGYVEPCGKCSGKGHILGYEYVEGGVCFNCRGLGSRDVPLPLEDRVNDVRRLADDTRKRDERFIIDTARRRAAWTAYATAEPEMAKWIEGDDSEFARDMRKLILSGKPMTPRQAQAARRAAGDYARRDERAAAEAAARAERIATARPLAEGETVAHEGTVTLAKVVDGAYGASKLLLVDAGDGLTLKVFSTSKAAWRAEEGDRLHIAGTAKAPQDDRYDGAPQTPVARPRVTLLATAEESDQVAA